MKNKFNDRIARFSAARRGLLNQVLALNLASHGMLTLLLALLLLSGFVPNAFVNLFLYLAAVVFLLTLPVRFFHRFSRFGSHMQEAFIMEALVGGLNSRLISAHDFLHHDEATSLKTLVIEKAAKDLELDFERRLSRDAFNRHTKRFAGILAVTSIALFFLAVPCLRNLTKSWNDAYNILYPVTYVLTPEAGKMHVHTLNDTVELRIAFNRDSVTDLTLILDAGDNDVESVPVQMLGNTGSYSLSSKVAKTYNATFVFGDRRTAPITIIFTTAPTLDTMQAELIYPTYTRMLPKSLEGIQQRIIGLPGTRVTLGFNFSKDITRATFSWDDASDPLDLDVVGRFASISLIHAKNRVATLQVEDIHGLHLEDPLQIEFSIQDDETPQVELPSFLKKDMPLKSEEAKFFSFGVRLQDDFGVQRCILSWQKASVDNPNAITDKGEIERMISPERQKTVVDFAKVFENMVLAPGDKISFLIQVFDNHRPNAQSAKSGIRSFFIFKDELEDWSINQAGLNKMNMLANVRISKQKRDTTVKNPDALRVKEKYLNDFDAVVDSAAKTATVRGPHQKETANYFKLMSELANERGSEK